MELFENNNWLVWLSVSSFAMFLFSLIALPIIVIRLPKDFFCRDPNKISVPGSASGPRELTVLMLRTIVGIILLVAGFLMLFLPGQGMLTILFALILLEFPGKKALLHKAMSFINRPYIISKLNGWRRKFNRPPLLDPHKLDHQKEVSLKP